MAAGSSNTNLPVTNIIALVVVTVLLLVLVIVGLFISSDSSSHFMVTKTTTITNTNTAEQIDALHQTIQQLREENQRLLEIITASQHNSTITTNDLLTSFCSTYYNETSVNIATLQAEIQRLKTELAPFSQPNTCTLFEYSQGEYNDDSFQSLCPMPSRLPICLANKKIAVMGDSNSFYLFTNMHRAYMGCKLKKSGSKCGEELTYFNFSPSPYWTPECRSCNSCVSQRYTCRYDAQYEYLAVELLEDHQLPSREFNTTQENVIEYLSRDPPDLLLLNAGMHLMLFYAVDDIFNGKPGAKSQEHPYHDRLLWLFQYIRRKLPNTRLVWLATPKILPAAWGGGRGHQEKDWYVEQHKLQNITRKVAAQSQVPILDLFSMSSTMDSLRSDAFHFRQENDKYYKITNDMIVNWYCSSDPPPEM